MQVTVHLEVSAAEIFDCIVRSIAFDAESVSRKKVPVKAIKKGYSYQKYLNPDRKYRSEVTVKVTECERPYVYESQFVLERDTNIIRYDMKSLDDGTCDVTYTEDIMSSSKVSVYSYKAISFFYKGQMRRRATAILKEMEKYILDKNNNDTNGE